MGQTSALLSLPLTLALLALRGGADWEAGLLLGLLGLKPQLLPIWGVARLASRRWRALGGLMITSLGLIAVSTMLAGPDWIVAWLTLGREVLSKTSGHGFEAINSRNLKALFTLIPRVDAPGANALQTGTALLLAGATALLWWRLPLPTLRTPAGARLIALTVLVMLLASPVYQPRPHVLGRGRRIPACGPADPAASWLGRVLVGLGACLAGPHLAFAGANQTAGALHAGGSGLVDPIAQVAKPTTHCS